MRRSVWLSLSESRLVPRMISVLVLAVGGVVFFGWLTNNPAIKNIFPDMSPLSGVTFGIAASAALLLTGRTGLLLPRVLAGSVVLIGILRLSEVLFGLNTGIDGLFGVIRYDDPLVLMAPNTALAFVLIAFALLPDEITSLRRILIGQTCALLVMLIAGVALAGHVLNLGSLYAFGVNAPMSLSTACLLGALALGALSMKLDRGLTTVLVSPTLGGAMIRRLLPLAILVPVALSGLQAALGRAGVYSDESDVIVFAALTVAVMVCMIWWNARVIDQADWARKQAQEALHASEARYRAIFEHTSNAIFLFDKQGHYLDANPEAERLTGYSRAELLSMPPGMLTSSARQPERAAIFDQLKQTEQLFSEHVIMCKGGTEITVELAATAIAPGLYQSMFHDISARKKAEENLRASLEKERDLNELKSRFVSMVSHDFRTPLAIIQSSSDLLLRYADRMDEEKRRDRLEKIQFQITRLIEMLDNILIVGKAQQVGLEFKAERLDVREFCASLVSEFQLAAPGRQIVFHSSGTCTNVTVDAKLLRQAITNLLSNAVKYSPGHAQVVLDLACDAAETVLQVQDHGIGIPEADQKHLFEFFHRAQNVGDISGTGLGLSIVKQAVDAHSGTVQVDSAVNVGTTFIIRLPRVPDALEVVKTQA